MKNYLLALDQGTTSSRAILFDKAGHIAGMGQHTFPQYYPKQGWVEHNPMEIWSSQASVIAEAITSIGINGRDIAGIAITNQRETTIVWDAETGESIADTAAKHQVFFTPGDNKRIPGWMQMHYRFAFDENGYPMMYIFSNCKAFIRTIPLLQYDEHKPEDLDSDGEDHVADEARYFCMSRPIKPRERAMPDEYYKNPLKLFLDVEKADLTSRTAIPKMQIISEDE